MVINERAFPSFGVQTNRLETEKLLVQDRDTLVFSWHDENEFIKKIGGTYSDSEKTEMSAKFSSTKSPSPNHTGTVVSSHWINSNTVTTGRTGETAGVSPSINSRETITFEQ